MGEFTLTKPPESGLMRPVARIAQSVEQGIENPRVLGSIPSPGTTYLKNPPTRRVFAFQRSNYPRDMPTALIYPFVPRKFGANFTSAYGVTLIRKLTAKPLAKSYKLTDSQGPYLTVSTSSAKLWYFRYRFGGKENRLAFGPYPKTTLAEAREKRDTARKLLASGLNPSQFRNEPQRAQLRAGCLRA